LDEKKKRVQSKPEPVQRTFRFFKKILWIDMMDLKAFSTLKAKSAY